MSGSLIYLTGKPLSITANQKEILLATPSGHLGLGDCRPPTGPRL